MTTGGWVLLVVSLSAVYESMTASCVASTDCM